MTKNAGRVANDLAMGTVYEFVTKMLVALQMTLPWVQSYAFGRFANDLAMDTVIRSRDENAGRFADVLALGAVIVFREENAGRLADDLAMGTGIRISNVNAGRLANDPAIVQSDEFVTKMVFAFQLTSPWVQS